MKTPTQHSQGQLAQRQGKALVRWVVFGCLAFFCLLALSPVIAVGPGSEPGGLREVASPSLRSSVGPAWTMSAHRFGSQPVIIKEVDKDVASAGDTLTYTITTSYEDTDLLSNAVITDAVPAGTTYVPGSANAGGVYITPTNTVSWTLGSNTAGVPTYTVGASGTVTFTAPISDTFLNSDSPDDDTKGEEAELKADKDKVNRPIVQFDISSIPVGVNIDSATLRMYVTRERSDAKVDVRRLEESWTETGATWNSRDGTTNWSTAGGTFSNTVSYGQLTAETDEVYEQVDIRTLVQYWYDNPAGNFGLLLDPDASMTTEEFKFGSRTNSGKEPELVVSYSAPSTGNSLDATRWLITSGDQITMTMSLTATRDTANVTPSALAITGTNSVTATCGSPSPTPPQNVISTTARVFTWVCTSTAATGNIGQLTFGGDASSAGGVTWAWAQSNRVMVVPPLTFQVTVDDSAAVNSVVNQATFRDDNAFPDGAQSNSVETQLEADVTIVKTDSPDSVVAGTTLTYTLVYTNAGPSEAQGVTITDTLPISVTYGGLVDQPLGWSGSPTYTSGPPATLTWYTPTLTADAWGTIVFTVTVDACTAGTITNSVVITSSTTELTSDNNDHEEPTAVTTSADLTISKSDDPTSVIAGETLTYTLVYTNTGPSDAQGVTITDTLPVSVTYGGVVSEVPSIAGPTVTPPYLTWYTPTLAAEVSGTIVFTVTVNASATGTITNSVVITSSTPDPSPVNNDHGEPTAVTTSADLTISKSDDPTSVIAGETLTYTLVYTNSGPSDAQGVTITDTLPVSLTYGGVVGQPLGWSDPPTYTSGPPATLTWYTPTLAASASGAIVFTVTVNASATGTITNSVVITSTTVDANPGNNSSDAGVPVIVDGTIVIEKVTDPAGGTGFGFTDNIAAPNNFNLDHGQTEPFNNVAPGSYTVTEIDSTVTPGGYSLTNLNCVESGTNNSFGTVGTRTATINLEVGETVTCTFTNEADADGDGLPDSVEGTGDRDGDGIPDNEDYDPTGYFYDEATGQIIPGGHIAVTGPGAVNIVEDGSSGYYAFTTDGTAGTYTMQVTLPWRYVWSSTCLRQDPSPFDPTGGPNPTVLGYGENAATGFLISNACTDYYLSFDLAAGDPFIFNNNFPLSYVPPPPVPVGAVIGPVDRGAVLRANSGPLVVPLVALAMLIGIIGFVVIRAGRWPESKPRNRQRLWVVAVGVLIILAIGGLAWTWLRPDLVAQSPPRAAIVDQVGLTHPNQEFVDLASAMLETAGYRVDVYSGDEITVEFYKDLATHGYRLIVFRTHSSDVDPTGEIGLFTSELYREDQWVVEQLRGRLAYGHTIADAGGPTYFAIVAAFIREEMRGRFDDTLLIIGGCKTLGSPQLAEAFLDRGASGVVGWDDTVDLAHNDRAILRLLLAIVGERMPLEEAVRRTTIDVGPDPVYHSWLGAYINPGR